MIVYATCLLGMKRGQKKENLKEKFPPFFGSINCERKGTEGEKIEGEKLMFLLRDFSLRFWGETEENGGKAEIDGPD